MFPIPVLTTAIVCQKAIVQRTFGVCVCHNTLESIVRRMLMNVKMLVRTFFVMNFLE